MISKIKGLIHLWKSQNSLTKCLIVSIICFVVFAYLPTLQFDYVTQDQWRAFRYSLSEQSSNARFWSCSSMVSKFYIQTGRPLVWPTECVEHAFVSQISDFKFLRPLSLTVVIFTVIYLATIIGGITESLITGLVVSAVFVTTPAYSFMYLQGLPALMVLISVILAAASYKRYSISLDKGRNRIKLLTYSSLLFLAACMIYPAFAFIVFPLALFRFVDGSQESITDRLKKLFMAIVFYGILSGIYYLFVKISVLSLVQFTGAIPNLGSYEVSPQLSPAVVIKRVSDVIEYFSMMPPLNFPAFHGGSLPLLIIFSLVAAFKATASHHKPTYGMAIIYTAIVFILSCVILLSSTAPWVFSKMDGLATRHLLPIYLFISFALVFTISSLLQSFFKLGSHKAALLLLLAILLPISIFQNQNSFLEVASTRAEIEILRDKINRGLEAGDLSKINRFILIIRPFSSTPRLIGIDRFLTTNKFGNDNAVLASSQNPVSLPWMITAILREQLIYRHSQIVDCGINTESCVAAALANPNNIVVAYADSSTIGDSNSISVSTKPYVINLSELTSKPLDPIIKS